MGGADCCCSVPGGRVASRCAGVCCGVVEVCGASVVAAVETTKGSPTFLKMDFRDCGTEAEIAEAVSSFGASTVFSGAASPRFVEAEALGEAVRDFAREEAVSFPKADTAFPKTRNAERQAAESAIAPRRVT